MKKNKNESGQALIELIIFLPIMFTVYALISGFANAINGSINQQKITRAYFYFRTMNNSYVPKPDYINQPYFSESWRKFGMFMIGWRENMANQTEPLMPCYKISFPIAAAQGDNCENSYGQPTTQYIRVGTVYGVCGGTFATQASEVVHLPDMMGATFNLVVDKGSCLITR